MQVLLLLNFIIPFVMILVGGILKKHSVSDMNSQNGYNTPTSRKSQAHWDYAQNVAPDIFISLGKILCLIELVASIVLFLLHAKVWISVVIGMCIGFVFLVLGFYRTDSKIKKEFENK